MLTAEQLSMRHTGLGASDFPGIAGLVKNNRGARFHIWLRKMGEPENDVAPEAKFAMDRGSYVERAIGDYVAATQGWSLKQGETVRHPEFDWIYATPDFLADGFLIECKDVALHSAQWWDDGPPDHVQAQVQIQMAVTGAPRVYVAASIAGTAPQVWPVDSDLEIQQELIRIGREFWFGHVVTRTPPPADDSEQATEFLTRRFRRNNGLMVPCDEARELAEEYKRADAEVKAAQAKKDLAGNRLRELIADKDGVIFPGGKVTWKLNGSAGTDWKSLALSFNPTEAQIAAHERPRSRVLRVSIKEA